MTDYVSRRDAEFVEKTLNIKILTTEDTEKKRNHGNTEGWKH
jgi:hypothetical protein